jgi:dihydrofolate synthase/folylpolyglutamate synthase
MLADKDIMASLSSLTDDVDYWYTGSLAIPRGASTQQMYTSLITMTDTVNCFDNIKEAFKIANAQANRMDLIIVFGSFLTVSQIRSQLIKT